MRPRFLTAPIAALAAVVLLGATVGGLVLANQPSSAPAAPADAETQPAPTPTATPEPAPTVVPAQAVTQVGAQGGTGLAPFELPPLPAKTIGVVEVVSVEEGSPASSGPVFRAEREAAAAAARSQRGQVFTWRDGDNMRRAVLQDDVAARETASAKSGDVAVVEGRQTSIVDRRSGQGSVEPVFRSESGGGLMTLPGGVLLALDATWDQAQVDDFFERNGISADRVTELGFVPNGFVVDTEPGFPSLELANALAGQDGVAVSSPNWWREVQAR